MSKKFEVNQEEIVQISVKGLNFMHLMIDDEVHEIDVEKFLYIDEGAIEEQHAKNPSEYAYYSSVLAWYEYDRDKKKVSLARLKASVELEVRQTFKNNHEKVTESRVAKEVEMDVSVMEAEDAYLRSCYVTNKLKAFVAGIEKKGDRLVQIYARFRKQEDAF